jgi:hypothetical protein
MPDNTMSGGGAEDSMPEGFEGLRPFYEGAGVTPPEDLRKAAPYLKIGAPIDDLANEVADFLRGKGLLFRGVNDEIVTIDEATGKLRPMTAQRLRTWLPQSAGLIPMVKWDKETGKVVKGELDQKQTSGILASDSLRLKLPLIEAVNAVPMPVLIDEVDEQGRRKMILSRMGYDATTRIYTIHGGLQYDESMSMEDAVAFFRRLFGFFPMDQRSLAVHLSAMLTLFCRRLFQGRTPLFLYNSNLGGSGKSKLAECAIAPIYGRPEAIGYDQFDQKGVKAELDSLANTYSPFVLYDDFELPGDTQLRSNHLNRWLTGDVWGSRTYGSNTERRGIPLDAVTLMTGIKLNLEAQLRRRTLFIDLFAKQKAADRALPKEATLITSSFIRSPERRRELLAAMWALVRHWDESGRPGTEVTGQKPLDSFEDWSEVVPPLVMTSGFANALEPFEAGDAGDLEGGELNTLVRSLIKEYLIDKGVTRATVTMIDIIRAARMNELFEQKLWSIDQVMSELESKRHKWRLTERHGDPYPDGKGGEKMESELTMEDKREQAAEWQNAKIGSSWGKYFKKLVTAGQHFECGGRMWEFGSRDNARGSKYEITAVDARS